MINFQVMNLFFKIRLLGVPISSGVRYILLGFCSSFTVSDPHSHFMGDYCPDADGMAAAAGIRTGDILKAIHLPDFGEDDTNVCGIAYILVF
jgi:hypothetical protein